MAEVLIAEDETSAEIVLGPGERLSSTSMGNILLARAGVRLGIDHAALASLAEVVGPASVRVAVAGSHRSVLGRALPTATPVVRHAATMPGDLTASDGLLQVAGDVHIRGDVTVHAAIAALGDVRIDGDLAGGRVACGGRVTVAGTIRRESTVEAGGGVWATGIEAAIVRTDGLIEVTGDVTRATLEAGALQVGGTLLGGEVTVSGEALVGAAGASEPTALIVAVPPRPRALEWLQAARRAESESQLVRLRQMLAAPNADAAAREKLSAAIATLEARLRKP